MKSFEARVYVVVVLCNIFAWSQCKLTQSNQLRCVLKHPIIHLLFASSLEFLFLGPSINLLSNSNAHKTHTEWAKCAQKQDLCSEYVIYTHSFGLVECTDQFLFNSIFAQSDSEIYKQIHNKSNRYCFSHFSPLHSIEMKKRATNILTTVWRATVQWKEMDLICIA